MVVSLLLNLARMFTGLICIRWITPEQMGIWQLMMLIESYLMFARFGIFNSLNRELPFYLGRGRTEKAMKYHDTAEGYAILISLLFLMVLPISLLFYHPPIVYWKECMLVFTAYLPFKFYSGFIELTFRSGRDFRNLAVVQLILIVFTILSVWLVYFFGFEGYLARVVVLAFIGLILMSWFRPFRFKADLNLQYLKQLFRMGMPLFASNYGQSVINSFPGMLILIFGNIATLGLYYPVSILMNFGSLVPGIISTYLYPQLSFDFGASKNAKEVVKKSISAGFSAMLIMVPVIAVLYFLLPEIFYRFAPQYTGAMVVSKWALLFSLVSCMNLFYNPFAVLKAWRPMYIFLLISAIVTWCIPYLVMSITDPHNILLALVLSLLLVKVILSIINYISIQMIHSTVAA
jgi:O-antigen/teichoic acid export membrane protein